MTEAQRKKYLRKRRKKQGLCTECGKPRDDPRKLVCSHCRAVTAQRVQRYRKK